MGKVRVHNFAVSLDGYAAGPGQDLENPLGIGAQRLHEWVFETRTGRKMIGLDGGTEGIDDEFLAKAEVGVGATIIGRNMFGPVRGPWEDESWTGWWGDEPPYHHPVFVHTHHPRPPLEMKGGTTFYFTSDGIDSVLDRAQEAANGADVRIGGGASTIQQYLRSGLIDDLHLAIVPVLLGDGERLFVGEIEGYECVEIVSSPAVAHMHLVRQES